MVNMTVEWAGPNSSLATLARELNARFGAPTRPYEYVTGYKSPYNVSGHNADSNGRGHSMDIFVGAGQNISVAQGIDVAERLRLEGKKGTIPGHPDRLAYIIHRGRIAGDHTNWEWVVYNGIADHYDHIHISSVFDYYWGDPVVGNPADYNSTAPWNLWGNTSGQGSEITPIQEDNLSASEVQQIMKGMASMEAGLRKNLNDHFLYGTKASDGWRPGATKIVIENQRRLNRANADIAALTEAVQQLAKGQGVVIDYSKIENSIKEALAEGIEITGSLTAKGTDS